MYIYIFTIFFFLFLSFVQFPQLNLQFSYRFCFQLFWYFAYVQYSITTQLNFLYVLERVPNVLDFLIVVLPIQDLACVLSPGIRKIQEIQIQELITAINFEVFTVFFSNNANVLLVFFFFLSFGFFISYRIRFVFVALNIDFLENYSINVTCVFLS